MNETWVYKIKNIDSIYQSMIVKYIAKGYKVITSHSGGSQSEQHKIDFTDGKDIYRIWYVEDSETIKNANDYYYGRINYILISVRKYKMDENSLYFHGTLWFGKGDIVEEKKFYLVNEYDKRDRINYGKTNNDKKVYFDNKEYAIREMQKSENRWKDNVVRNKITLSNENKKRIVEMIKKIKGFSNLRIKDVDYLMHIIEYGNSKYVVYFSKEYKKTYSLQLKVTEIWFPK